MPGSRERLGSQEGSIDANGMASEDGASAVLMAGLFAIGGSAPALAQPAGSATAREAARQNYREAETRFERGDYAGAVGLFEQAEAIVPIWQTKFKIALCRDKLGQTAEAIRWYQAFLDAQPPEKLADSANEARARLSALRGKASSQLRMVVSPPNAPNLVYSVDNGPGQLPAPALSLPPGHHRVVVQATGYAPVAVEVDLAASDAREVRITLTPAAAVQPAIVGALAPAPSQQPVQDTPSRRRSDVPAYVLLGLAGAGAILGTAFGAIALGDKSSFNKTPTSAGADKAQRDARIADISFGVGLACAITGVVLLVTNTSRPAQSGSIDGGPGPKPPSLGFLTPYAGPTGGGVVGGLHF